MIDNSNAWVDLTESVISCHLCKRLVAWRERVAQEKRRAYKEWTYWGKPVPGFGDPQGRVLVVGLAPGAHGANRTGRMFTGDSSGDFLYGALHQAGFANQPTSIQREDGLQLSDLYISAVCRCVPPGNKPSAAEIGNCLPYLEREIQLMKNLTGIVALGRIAFEGTLRLLRQLGFEIPRQSFVHGKVYKLADLSFGSQLPWMVASYHPSRQNTQTGRLTAEMFAQVWKQVRELLT